MDNTVKTDKKQVGTIANKLEINNTIDEITKEMYRFKFFNAILD